jgi:hypothetical protein
MHTNCNKLATSVDVKWIFSQGQFLLSHVHRQLSVQSTQALLCLGSWSKMSFIKDKNVMADVDGEEEEFEDGWDAMWK